MSGNDGKKGQVAETRDEVSGTAGLERTGGTTSTSTGTVERTGVAPAMVDTGNLASSPTTKDSTTTTSDEHSKK